MDLLGNYGSDAESDASEEEETQEKNAGRAVFITPGSSANHSEVGSEPDSKAEVSRTGLFASLPPPRNGLEEDSTGKESSRSLFAKLPAPKASSGRQSLADLQSDLGLGGMMPLATVVPPKRGIVQFRPPIDTSYLSKAEDDDDDAWQPPRKKGRKADPPEGGAAEKPSKSSFASFLPPPKNSLGAGNILGGGASGGRKMAMDTAAALGFEEERPRIELDTNEEATPSGRGAPPAGVSPAAVERDSNGGVAEELPLGSFHPPPVEAGVGYQSQVDYSHPSDAFLHSGQVGNGQPAAYNPSVQPYQSQTYTAPEYQAHLSAQADVWQPDEATNAAQAGQPMDLLTAKLMEEEGRRMRRRGAHGPQLVEVKQADITSGTYRREDMLKSGASTFGPQAQPVSSAKDAGPKKLERRKHQISSLYADMKKKEMEMMDSRATGMQTKAQTKGKYGW